MNWKKTRLGNVLNYEQPTKYIVTSIRYSDDYKIPVLTAGQSFILGYTNEIENIYDNLPVIIFDDFTTATKFVDFPFKVKSSAMKILKANSEISDIRFLFYLIQTIKLNSDQHKRYWISKYAELKIPLPPLETQKKIAHILDEADTLRQLDKKLIEKYDALGQSLFLEMFGDIINNQKEFDFISFGKIFNSLRYGTSSPPDYLTEGIPFIRATNVKNGGISLKGMVYISDEEAAKINKCKLKEGDLIVVRSGANTGDCSRIPKEYEGSYGGFDIIIEIDEPHSTFYNFLLNTSAGKAILEPLTRRAGQPHINARQLTNLKVLDVSLDLQNQFVTRIKVIEQQKYQAQQSLQKSEELFNSLLQKAFKGELVKD